jgi:murein L,D-transpeptidase YcbB/YkuD
MTQKSVSLSLTLSLLLAGHAAMAQELDPLSPPSLQAPSLVDPLPAAPLATLSQSAGFPGLVEAAAQQMTQQSILVSGPAPARALRLGDSGPEVQWLIDALAAHGYRAISPADAPVAFESPNQWSGSPVGAELAQFDQVLDATVRVFQTYNGLGVDGVAGTNVYRKLIQDNRAIGAAGAAWAANLHRWSNEARSAGHDRMIVVNIPSFTLHAIDLTTNEEIIQSRVIVGKSYTRTPLMMTRVVNLKANPDWSPPKSIRGARYQRPGPNNALGLMRFSTDNNMNIYLHDTNARGLFAQDHRALSHGCVRVQQWKPLAAWAAREDEAWVDDIALAGGKTRFLKVDSIPVVITYSRVDLVDGQLREYADIYGRGANAIGHAELNGGWSDTWSWTQNR